MAELLPGWPLVWAKVGAASMFGLVLLLTWMHPTRFVWSGAPDRSRWRDLRIWATILTGIQMILYAIF